MAATATIGDLLQGREASGPSNAERALGRVARHPAIRLALLIAQTERESAELRDQPGMSTVGGLMAHPNAQAIVANHNLLYGRQPTTSLSSLYSGLVTPGKYGVAFSNDELVPALSDVLSIAAGRPIDATAVTPEEAMEILDGYKAEAASGDEERTRAESGTTEGNVSVRSEAKVEECRGHGHDVKEALYRNKRAPENTGPNGRPSGSHGLFRRIAEQICGASPPGSNSFQSHQREIRGAARAVRDAYNAGNAADCSPEDMELSEDEKAMAERLKWDRDAKDSMPILLATVKSSYQGPNSNQCAALTGQIGTGRLPWRLLRNMLR